MPTLIGEPEEGWVMGYKVPWDLCQYVNKLEGEVTRLKHEAKGYETDLRVLAQERHKLALEVKKLKGEPIIESENLQA